MPCFIVVEIGLIDEIVLGQTTDIFKRELQPNLVSTSFSIIYSKKSRSLDLIAKTFYDFRLWVDTLNSMLSFLAKGEGNVFDLSSKTSWMISTPGLNTQKPDQAIDFVLLEKQVVAGYFDICKRLSKFSNRCNLPEFRNSVHFKSIAEVLSSANLGVTKIKTLMETRDWIQANEEIKKTNLDLEQCRNLMRSLVM